MEASKQPSHRLLDEPPPSKPIPGEEAAITGKGVSGSTHELDKRSLDYILRSGLAGGLAGCAVGCHSSG
jgi:hypothetical protein